MASEMTDARMDGSDFAGSQLDKSKNQKESKRKIRTPWVTTSGSLPHQQMANTLRNVSDMVWGTDMNSNKKVLVFKD